MSLSRSLSADNLPELSDTQWAHEAGAPPRLLFYNDGTGFVLELKRPGRSEPHCGEEGVGNSRQLPLAMARTAERIADFAAELGEPCSRHFLPTVIGSFVFAGVVLLSHWFVKTHGFPAAAGVPVVWDPSFPSTDILS